jgi:hypothetical protein
LSRLLRFHHLNLQDLLGQLRRQDPQDPLGLLHLRLLHLDLLDPLGQLHWHQLHLLDRYNQLRQENL